MSVKKKKAGTKREAGQGDLVPWKADNVSLLKGPTQSRDILKSLYEYHELIRLDVFTLNHSYRRNAVSVKKRSGEDYLEEEALKKKKQRNVEGRVSQHVSRQV